MSKINRRNVMARKRVSYEIVFENIEGRGSEVILPKPIYGKWQFTIEMFITIPHVIQTHQWHSVFQFGYSDNYILNYVIGKTGNCAYNYTSSGSLPNITLGQKYKVVFTHGGSQGTGKPIQYYRDGVLDGTSAQNAYDWYQDFIMGGRRADWNNDALEAKISHIAFYDYSKDAATILAEAKRKPQVGDTGLLRLYKGKVKNGIVFESVEGAHGTFSY